MQTLSIHRLAFVAMLVLAAGCSSDSGSGRSGGSGGSAAWEPFAPQGEGFAAEFPASPEKEVDNSGVGGAELRSYSADVGGVFYIVEVCDLSDETVATGTEAIFDEADEGYIEEAVKDRQESEVDGNPVLDITVQLTEELAGVNRHITSRHILAGNRLYHLVVNAADESAGDVEKFFNGFSLK